MSQILPPPAEFAGRGARSLRAKLGFALALLMLTASLLLAGGLAAYARREFLYLAQENVEALAAQMARELSFGMDRFAREIELQASRPVFSDAREPVPLLRKQLEAIQRAYPEFAYLAVVDVRTATVVAATGGIFEGGSAKGRPAFEEGMNRLFVGDVHDAVKLAALLPKQASGEPLRFLDVSAPIHEDSGAVSRVLATHLSWQWTQTIKQSVLAPVEASRKVQLMLVDTDGRIVLPPDATIAVGTTLAQAMGEASLNPEKPWSDGRAYIRAEAPTFASGSFKGLGWRIVARQPVSIAMSPSERLRYFFLGGGLLLGLLAAGLGWLVAGRIVRPVSELARAAASLQPGSNLSAEHHPDEPHEVAQVRDAFRRVAGDALRRAEGLLDELNAIYGGAPVALAVIDNDCRYLRANRVWCEAFAGSHEVAPGQAVANAGMPSALLESVQSVIGGGVPFATEVDVVGIGPSQSWQTVFAPLRDESGRVTGVSAVATDVTEIRRAEREMRQADKRKSEFVSMLAHELRNPLAPIVNAVEILDRRPAEDQAKRMRTMIRKQAKLMTRLVDDLLDLSRVNLGKIGLRLGPVSIREVCVDAVDSLRHLAQEKGQRIEMSIDDWLPELRADKSRLEQVVCNLVTNAIKYGRDGGDIAISARLHGECVVLSVQDNGRGIGPDFMPNLFELFAQEVPGHGGAQGGLGIGLALVRKIVELHGGTVEACSEGVGKGSRFEVRLPVLLVSGSREEAVREAAAIPGAK